jgi:hypothetical protein
MERAGSERQNPGDLRRGTAKVYLAVIASAAKQSSFLSVARRIVSLRSQ